MRGDFAFGDNHHPIQDIYVREVIKEGDVFTNKIIATGLSRPMRMLMRLNAKCKLHEREGNFPSRTVQGK